MPGRLDRRAPDREASAQGRSKRWLRRLAPPWIAADPVITEAVKRLEGGLGEGIDCRRASRQGAAMPGMVENCSLRHAILAFGPCWQDLGVYYLMSGRVGEFFARKGLTGSRPDCRKPILTKGDPAPLTLHNA
jgi:hypothetical protein